MFREGRVEDKNNEGLSTETRFPEDKLHLSLSAKSQSKTLIDASALKYGTGIGQLLMISWDQCLLVFLN